MEKRTSSYGNILIGTESEVFEKALDLIAQTAAKGPLLTVGLSGGSTPQRWYRWLTENKHLWPELAQRTCWTTSDERNVPLEDSESNFGNAVRLFLDPLNIPDSLRMPWPTNVDPHSASIVFNQRWNDKFGVHRCFDVCFLGMGDDGHTASIFPGSPLLGIESRDNFASVEVPGKGWRFTVTPNGLTKCGQLVVIALGSSKAQRLKSVLHGEYNPGEQPIQLLRDSADRVTWLVDQAAAALL